MLSVIVWISPAYGGGPAHATGASWWLGVTVVGGLVVSGVLQLAIIYFNRPRWLVPPFMRTELGITTAWWRSRDQRSRR